MWATVTEYVDMVVGQAVVLSITVDRHVMNPLVEVGVMACWYVHGLRACSWVKVVFVGVFVYFGRTSEDLICMRL